MSAMAERFDTGVCDAASLVVREYGVEGAIEHLNERRQARDGDVGAINEALAYIRWRYQ